MYSSFSLIIDKSKFSTRRHRDWKVPGQKCVKTRRRESSTFLSRPSEVRGRDRGTNRGIDKQVSTTVSSQMWGLSRNYVVTRRDVRRDREPINGSPSPHPPSPPPRINLGWWTRIRKRGQPCAHPRPRPSPARETSRISILAEVNRRPFEGKGKPTIELARARRAANGEIRPRTGNGAARWRKTHEHYVSMCVPRGSLSALRPLSAFLARQRPRRALYCPTPDEFAFARREALINEPDTYRPGILRSRYARIERRGNLSATIGRICHFIVGLISLVLRVAKVSSL